jgi:pSer/pThr/pTyr-binding forkhead associated (FHA) protein
MEEMFKKFSMTPEELEQRSEAMAQLQFLSEKNNDYATSRTDKKQKEEEEQPAYQKVDPSRPHLVNLNPDPQLSRKIKYSLDSDQSRIGKRGLTPPNDIEIGGMGIRQLHALILRRGDEYFVSVGEGEGSGCFLNGDEIPKEERLLHLDRISFGTNNIFLLLLPGTLPRAEIDEKAVDWDFAQNELYLKKESIEREINEEKERKLKEETAAVLREKEAELVELQRSLQESEELRRKIEEQKESERGELERRIR